MAPEAAVAADDDYHENVNTEDETNGDDSITLPEWVREGKCEDPSYTAWGEILEVPEWQDDGGEYRDKNGWKGRDLIHDRNSAVRVLEYYVKYGPGVDQSHENNLQLNPGRRPSVYRNFGRGGIGTTLTGIVHFTKRAESHKGYCHGGSMCSIMDDVIGWVGFLVSGECKPWSGFTVQINTNLQRPVHVDSILLVKATITKVERRKVAIEAVIMDPKDGDDNCIHATASGLVVVNRGVLCEE
mmetsp:Transcript_7688/g.18836  ORF Transcript_7688/g.18836 Transcript_7688/m.18836 type:complete len:242 (+) Transcript_7688:143-868(+)